MLQRSGALPPVREVKFARLDLKRVDADGIFSGYASLFSKEDMGRDVVMPGAFAESLKSRGASAIKLLFQHDPNEPIGVWLEIREDAKGLWVRGRLMQDVARAREILSLMRAGAIDGLSIGFRTVSGRTDPKTGVRRLHKIDLWEISVVTFPMLPEARVDAVKRRSAREGIISSRDELMRKLAVETSRLRAHVRALSKPGPKPLAKALHAAGGASPHARMLGALRHVAGTKHLGSRPQPHEEHMTEQIPARGIETKAAGEASGADVALAFDDFLMAFEAFKETNDERLSQIESRVSTDVLTSEKLERINKALDENKALADSLTIKAARPQLGGLPIRSGVTLQHKAAFDGYMRSGESGGLRALEGKALSVGADPDGGYLVPDETETTVMRSLKDISPIRAIASIRQVSATTYKKPFSITGPGAGWVGEAGARPETTSPTLAELTFPTMELYAMPSATQSLLDDSAVNIDEWLADEIRIAFAEQEGSAFVVGDGANRPKGFLNYTKVANSSWSHGNVGYIATGVDGGFNATNPSDNLIDLIYSAKSGYRGNGRWVMNRSTQAGIRKIKDADGNYIWQPGERAGAEPTLMNYRIVESEDMPDIGTDSFSIAFGDFQRGYLIVDRVGLRVLRDPYSAKPYVLFYTTKRVGGGIQDFDALKLLKFGKS